MYQEIYDTLDMVVRVSFPVGFGIMAISLMFDRQRRRRLLVNHLRHAYSRSEVMGWTTKKSSGRKLSSGWHARGIGSFGSSQARRSRTRPGDAAT